VPSRKGWLTPNSGATETICRPLLVPLDDQLFFLAAVSGALLDLTRAYNWEQFGDMTPAEAAEVMQTLYDDYVANTDDCGVCVIPFPFDFDIGFDIHITRIGEDGGFEELIDGVWQTPAGDYAVPEPDARTESTADERKCLAAANVVEVLKVVYETASDSFIADPTAANVYEGVLGALAAGLGAWAVGFAASGIGLAIAGFFVFYELLETVTSDLWLSSFDNELICIFYANATDTAGVVTFDWDGILRDFMDLTVAGGLDLDRQLLLQQVLFILYTIGLDGINIAGATTDITSFDCDYCLDYCYFFNLGTNDGGLTNFGANTGVWTSGLGWRGQIFSSQNKEYLEVHKTFTSTYVHSVTYGYDKAAGAGANNATVLRVKNAGSTVVQDTSNPTGLDQMRTLTVNAMIDEIYFVANNGTSGAQITLESITINGHGTNPFTGGADC